MEYLLTILFFAALLHGASTTSIDECPSGLPRDRYLRAHGSSCYYFDLAHSREFNTAERSCEARAPGGHLVTIKNIDTQRFIISTLRNVLHFGGTIWIGLSDAANENTWTWADGSGKAQFTYWASDQPGLLGAFEDCAAIKMEDGRWHDYQCEDFLFKDNDHSFICEYPVVARTTQSTTTTTPVPTTTVTTLPTTTTAPTTVTTTPLPTTTLPTTLPTTTTMMTTTPTTTTIPTTASTLPSTRESTTPPPPTTQTIPPDTTVSSTLTTSVVTDATGCPAFHCALDCDLSGYARGDDGCVLCQCED